jgi:hypothetical protein
MPADELRDWLHRSTLPGARQLAKARRPTEQAEPDWPTDPKPAASPRS